MGDRAPRATAPSSSASRIAVAKGMVSWGSYSASGRCQATNGPSPRGCALPGPPFKPVRDYLDEALLS